MERFGRYLIGREVRVTDFASVHRAHLVMERGQTRTVLIRRIVDGLRDRADIQGLLLEDVTIRSQLEHPGITGALDLGREDGRWFAVEDRLAGQDLATVLKRARTRGAPVDAEMALHIGIALLEALEHAHERTGDDGTPLGLVHRDVCPVNVLVGYSGHVRLGGFAYAKSRRRPQPPQPGAVQPRYGYLSPEQAVGGEVDPRADLFSVALILFEILSGQAAYEARSELEALALAQRGMPRALDEVAPDIAPEIRAAVSSALSFDREARPASATAFRDTLAALLFSRAPTYSARRAAAWMEQAFAGELLTDREEELEERARARAAPARRLEAPAMTEPSGPGVGARQGGSTLPDSSSSSRRWSGPTPSAVVDFDTRLGGSNPRARTGRLASSLGAWSHPAAPSPLALLRGRRIGFGLAILLFFGAAGLTLVALTSDKTRRLVERRVRAAVVGREPGGTITFESLPAGARLYIDGEDTGQVTPVTVENLESGVIHDVRLELAGEPAVTSTVGIEAGKRALVTLTFPGAVVSLAVTSEPSGAEVMIDGRDVARTPASLKVRVGRPLEVRVLSDGFQPYVANIAPERGRRVELDVKLAPLE